jgi:signal transduction histidine kinase
LTLYYWRERRVRPQEGGLVFRVFTLVCAAAFVLNLALQAVGAQNSDSAWATAFTVGLELVTGLLPPLLFHLVYAEESRYLPWRRWWPSLLRGFYGLSVLAALAKGLDDTDAIAGWTDGLDAARALLLGAAGALGLAVQLLSRRRLNALELRHRRWLQALLCLTILAAAANLARPGPLVGLFPDYLLLAFFCVTLYFKERLVFFDLLLKRGAFFLVALSGLTCFFLLGPQNLSSDWTRPWICALLLLPFWLISPWIFRRLERWIDRVWLGRRYAPPDAERIFAQDLQAASSEDELRSRAAQSLSAIFQTSADVRFTAAADMGPPLFEGNLRVDLEQGGVRLGWAELAARGSTPFLSGDWNLLQSLAHTLTMMLENIRFRRQTLEQQEREQQLRLLASRAELKALRAQIDPHFLFNALNAIAGLIPGQPQKADETVEHLAEVFRYTLRKSHKEWVRLQEEVEFITAYLRVEQARFGERLQVEFDVEPAAGEIAIPAMTIQPLVENAIRHGVSAVEGCGKIGLRAALRQGVLRVEVLDNGPGFPPGFALRKNGAGSATGGYGLHNVAERIAGYYGSSARLGWDSGPGGTRVFLEIGPEPIGSVSDTRFDRG